MKNIIPFLIILLFSCDNTSRRDSENETNNQTDSLATGGVMQPVYEDSLHSNFWMDSLLSIDFVKKSNVYIDSFSNHKHGIAFLADSSNANEILFSAGYNGPERFETYYQFYVYPATKQILVYDPANDAKLTLEEYTKKINQ